MVDQNQEFHRAPSLNHLIGRLASGTNVAMVTASTWADDGSGGVETGSKISVSGTVTRKDTASVQLGFLITPNTDIVIPAGSSQTVTFLVRRMSEFPYMDIQGLSNPTIYIRKPAGIRIDKSSISITGKAGVTHTVTEYTTA